MRYQFYREHKFVSAALNDLERLIAKADFRDKDQLKAVKEAFSGLTEMLKGHAEYENLKLHTLLKKKNSQLHLNAEEDHLHQDLQIKDISDLINAIAHSQDKVNLGYQLYLAYRKFVADNLTHLHEEETIILPELQRLYTDEELKQVEAETYKIMTPEEMAEMIVVLFPHMNPTDRAAFLSDIKDCQPDKFIKLMERLPADLK